MILWKFKIQKLKKKNYMNFFFFFRVETNSGFYLFRITLYNGKNNDIFLTK